MVHTNIPLSPVYRDLELERNGVRYVYPDHLRGTIFPDGKSLVMYRDPARMAAEIGRFSARDAKTFTQLVEDYGEFIDSTYLPLMYSPPLPPSMQSGRAGEVGGGARAHAVAGEHAGAAARRAVRKRAGQGPLPARLTVLGFPPDAFGQGWICLFRILKAEAPICVGGSQQLAEGLRRVVEGAGGVVKTGAGREAHPPARQQGVRRGAERRHAASRPRRR